MQLSKFTDYAFRALIYLANNRSKLCTVEELAQELNASEHHIKKVIHKLAKTEYIISSKGRGGGLQLGLEPVDINLGEVLKFTEDNLNIVECFNKPELCPFMQSGCKLKAISAGALKNFIEEFSKYTLNDVL
ncbi:Rrf2 family transcriptional regulator [Clostridium sp. NSJ-6]|uniref:HTH-type transcriptional regulator NsrR n=1 Tax=Clostridium hominis TaxID=2763036 RepID=A0ABR7DDZ5_9CLOT|nr:Rrf2 family transcriptional regulator [Clostridium hominis]MBC5629657.1 Rrf2 family transcriptional regulator [Clostridium hominis]MDU2673521.1 Rrf2 family transcriptional regulator [Clostridium sp.]